MREEIGHRLAVMGTSNSLGKHRAHVNQLCGCVCVCEWVCECVWGGGRQYSVESMLHYKLYKNSIHKLKYRFGSLSFEIGQYEHKRLSKIATKND